MSGLILTTVRRKAAGVLWIISLGLSSALAFEPFQVNVKENKPQPRTQDVDHLLPLEQTFTPPPEFGYLAQYWAKESTENYRYVVVFRNEQNGRFYVCEGDVPRHKVHPEQCQWKHKAEISPETAQLVYDFWSNMLLETRYSRQLLPHMPPATLYIFSTCIAGGSWLHGYTLFPGVSQNLPPYLLAQAGEDLYAFVTKSPLDEKDLAEKIKANRDRYYAYRDAHPCQ
jgi:hypothetical protein